MARSDSVVTHSTVFSDISVNLREIESQLQSSKKWTSSSSKPHSLDTNGINPADIPVRTLPASAANLSELRTPYIDEADRMNIGLFKELFMIEVAEVLLGFETAADVQFQVVMLRKEFKQQIEALVHLSAATKKEKGTGRAAGGADIHEEIVTGVADVADIPQSELSVCAHVVRVADKQDAIAGFQIMLAE
jgi:hypothetical protein